MRQLKILYGICGIGNGHIFRQLPILKYFAKEGHRIVIFAYDASFKFFSELKEKEKFENISVVPVGVPYFPGNSKGLDFSAAAHLPSNQVSFIKINSQAMASAEQFVGCPDLVISDYEPISAQYAYAHGAPLVTLDQQSKYLLGGFPHDLNGQTYIDEVMRLRMFFPLAERRFACSFFKVPESPEHEKKFSEKESPFNPKKATLFDSYRIKVEIVPPVLRQEVIDLKRSPSTQKPSLLVYLTAQHGLKQPLNEIIQCLKTVSEVTYEIFLPRNLEKPAIHTDFMNFYHHGDPVFEKILSECHGIVSTAGHTLLSEAMHLGIPVYAIPLELYEQQMNASVIEQNQFGISSPKITEDLLKKFIPRLSDFSENIRKDQTILLHGAGQRNVIQSLQPLIR